MPNGRRRRKVGAECICAAALLFAGNAGRAQSLTRDLPAACGMCKAETGPGTIGIGPVWGWGQKELAQAEVLLHRVSPPMRDS